MTANERQVGGDHYKTGGGLELWELFGPPFLMGYAAKYVQRWRRKNGVEDLEKALHICEKLREIAPQFTGGAGYLVFADDLIESWFDNSGMDWAEKTIVHKIVYWKNTDDVDAAIAGIKYLISASDKVLKVSSVTVTSPDGKLQRTLKDDGGYVEEFMIPKSYAEMTDEELATERAALDKKQAEAAGWSAAVGARHESMREIEQEQAKRERRVPRYDVNIKHTNKDILLHHYGDEPWPKEPQHPDVVRKLKYPNEPWVITHSTFFGESNFDTPLINLWYQRRGDVFVLEPYVIAENPPPNSIRGIYLPHLNSAWVLDMQRCPKDARDYFPNLQPSKNQIEWDEAPEWQKRLYEWVQKGNKYVLKDETWHHVNEEEDRQT